MKPGKPKRSLLERADAAFDFGGQLRRIEPGQIGDGPVVDAPSRSRATQPGRKTVRVSKEPVPPVEEAVAEQPAASTPAPAPAPTASATPAPTQRPQMPVPHRRFVPKAARQTIDRTLLAEHGLIDPDNNAGALAEEFRIVKRQLLRSAASSSPRPSLTRARAFRC